MLNLLALATSIKVLSGLYCFRGRFLRQSGDPPIVESFASILSWSGSWTMDRDVNHDDPKL